MSAFTKLTEAVTCRYHDRIKKACAPLFESLNLCDFWHIKIKNSGLFYYFAAHVQWTEFFAREKHYLVSPFHCHPKLLQPGISFLRAISDHSFLNSLDVSRDKFNVNPCLFLLNKTADGMEGFGFSSNSSDSLQNMAVLRSEIPILQLFIKKFREDHRFLFSCLEDNQIDLTEIFGPAFYEERPPLVPQVASRRALLRHLGIEYSPTIGEAKVAKLLVRGLSANQMAEQLFLSRRTVEHHVERMKEKLRCESRMELVQKIRELEELRVLE